MSDYIHPSILLPRMAQQLLGERAHRCSSMLDIGGGSGVVGEAAWRVAGIVRIAVADAWDGYSQRSDVEVYCLRGTDALERFGPDSFDVVQCCECIEHMTRKDGDRLLADMKLLAKHLVIMTCPNGFTVQDPEQAPNEPWSANPYQLHVSGWTAEDFARHGYQVDRNPPDSPAPQLVPYWVRP